MTKGTGTNVVDEIRARRIVIVDDEGRERIRLEVQDDGTAIVDVQSALDEDTWISIYTDMPGDDTGPATALHVNKGDVYTDALVL